MTSLIKKINEIHNNNNLSLVTDLIKKHFNEIKYIDTELIIVIKDSFIDIFEKNKIIQIIEIFKDIECNFDKKEDEMNTIINTIIDNFIKICIDKNNIYKIDELIKDSFFNAIENKNLKNTEILLKKGEAKKHLNSFMKNFMSPLTFICKNGMIDFVKLFIKYEINDIINPEINVSSIHNLLPLHAACQYIQYEIVELLIENGANLNSKSCTSKTALHHLCNSIPKIDENDIEKYMKNVAKIAKLLILKGANINEIDNFGWTALHYASFRYRDHYKNKELIKILLYYNNNNLYIKDSTDKTPLYFILDNSDREDFEELKEYIHIFKLKKKLTKNTDNNKLINIFNIMLNCYKIKK